LTREIKDSSAGLVAACLISIVPGYISRSVAGSYDNEGIAIFCMLLTYWLWVRSVKTGSMFWSAACALAYFYMVSSWGGYVFLINLIPLHVLALMISGRFSHKVYVAYSTVYILGTLLSMQISFVGFQPIQSSEHMAAFGVFGLCQLLAFYQFAQTKLSQEQFNVLFKFCVFSLGGVAGLAGIYLTITGSKYPKMDTKATIFVSINLNFLFKKFRHGLEDSTRFWIHRMPRITFRLLRRSVSINRPVGVRSFSICRFLLSCFQVSYRNFEHFTVFLVAERFFYWI
jgi:hypothetical protein